jgi:subtilisin family serine protease
MGVMSNHRSSRRAGILAVPFAFSLWAASASAQPPVPLPVPGDLPPCDLGVPPSQASAVFPCGVILSSPTGLSADQLSVIIEQAGGVTRFRFHSVNAAAAVVASQDVLRALTQRPDINVIPDRQVMAIGVAAGAAGKGKGGAAEPAQVIPEGIRRIGAAPGVLSVTGKGVGVAIVDTGIATHPDLALGLACFDAFGGNCRDGNGHGTHVTGIVAALNNAIDVVGVAPDATPYAVRVLDSSGTGSDSTVMAGLQWIIDNGGAVTPKIKVANLSLGRPGTLDDNPSLRALFQTLRSNGVSVAVAAGNDPSKEVSQMVPATYPEVMAIASTAAKDGINQCKFFSGKIGADTASWFTTDGALDGYGVGVTVSAPGEDEEDISRGCSISSLGILSLNATGGTTRMSGTSMASPHAAGVLALMVEANGGTLDPETARSFIRSTAFRLGEAPLDSPTSSYTFDGEREGILSACYATGAACP